MTGFPISDQLTTIRENAPLGLWWKLAASKLYNEDKAINLSKLLRSYLEAQRALALEEEQGSWTVVERKEISRLESKVDGVVKERDANFVDFLNKVEGLVARSGRTKAECEKALEAAGGDYDRALTELRLEVKK